jgi:hypothetical protein
VNARGDRCPHGLTRFALPIAYRRPDGLFLRLRHWTRLEAPLAHGIDGRLVEHRDGLTNQGIDDSPQSVDRRIEHHSPRDAIQTCDRWIDRPLIGQSPWRWSGSERNVAGGAVRERDRLFARECRWGPRRWRWHQFSHAMWRIRNWRQWPRCARWVPPSSHPKRAASDRDRDEPTPTCHSVLLLPTHGSYAYRGRLLNRCAAA